MSVRLLDTNIVSFIFKGDSRASDYHPHLHGQQLAISFMTVAELYQWAEIRNWGQKRKNRLLETLKTTYNILAFDLNLCLIWGSLRAEQRAKGRSISPQDAWIGATALHYGLPLVTHNPKDFLDIPNLQIITTAK